MFAATRKEDLVPVGNATSGLKTGRILHPIGYPFLAFDLRPSVTDLSFWRDAGGYGWLERTGGVEALARACGFHALTLVLDSGSAEMGARA